MCKFSGNLLKMWILILTLVLDFQQNLNSSEVRVPMCQCPYTSMASLIVSVLYSEWYVLQSVQLYPHIIFTQRSHYTLGFLLDVHSTGWSGS